MTHNKETGKGYAYALSAYLSWGLAVFFFKTITHVPAVEVVCHRTVWSAALLILILAAKRDLMSLFRTFSNRRELTFLTFSALSIAISWYSYIWAVENNRVLDASVAYYIMPLGNVIFGRIFLKERHRTWQKVSVFLACIGVIIQAISYGQIPIISLVIALSFCTYGLLRKKISVNGTTGFAVESVLLTPIALTIVAYLQNHGELVFAHYEFKTDMLLVATGAITALPLVWYVNATSRLQLSNAGIMMYILPTMLFLSAIYVYDEGFGVWHLVSFCCIWLALLIYTLESILHAGTKRTMRMKEKYLPGTIGEPRMATTSNMTSTLAKRESMPLNENDNVLLQQDNLLQ